MAWQVRINGIGATNPQTISVNVDFYDDTILGQDGLPIVQFAQQFSFPNNTPQATMRAAILSAGADARACYVRAQTLLTQVPPGTVIAVP